MILSVGAQFHPLGHRFRRHPDYPYWTLSFGRCGCTRLAIGGDVLLNPGPSLSLVSPRVPYSVEITDPKDETWVIFAAKPAWEPLLRWPLTPFGNAIIPLAGWSRLADMERAWSDLLLEHQRPEAGSQALVDNCLERILLLCHLLNPLVGQSLADDRIKVVIDHLRNHVAEPLAVGDLADLVHLSPSRFAHLFRTATGRTPMQMQEELRLAAARDLLLTTNLPIHEIAAAVGYVNPYHFTARFTRTVGVAPRIWRRHPTG